MSRKLPKSVEVYLEQVKTGPENDIARLEYRLEELETETQRVTADLSGMPKSGSDGGYRLENILDEIDRTRRRLSGLLLRSYRAEKEAEDFLNNITDADARVILSMRYIDGKTLAETAAILGLSEKTIQRKRKSALVKAQTVYDRWRMEGE